METAHITQRVLRPAEAVYEYARRVENLPAWAAGVGADMEITMAEPNPFGVLDHWALVDGTSYYNPMRVIPDGSDACEVVFTLSARPDMDEAGFESDRAAVAADLATLRDIVEAR